MCISIILHIGTHTYANAASTTIQCDQNATFLLPSKCDRVEGILSIMDRYAGTLCITPSCLVPHKKGDGWYSLHGSNASCRLALRYRPFPPIEAGSRRDPFGFLKPSSQQLPPSNGSNAGGTDRVWNAGRTEIWFKMSQAKAKRQEHLDQSPPSTFDSYSVGPLTEKVCVYVCMCVCV